MRYCRLQLSEKLSYMKNTVVQIKIVHVCQLLSPCVQTVTVYMQLLSLEGVKIRPHNSVV